MALMEDKLLGKFSFEYVGIFNSIWETILSLIDDLPFDLSIKHA